MFFFHFLLVKDVMTHLDWLLVLFCFVLVGRWMDDAQKKNLHCAARAVSFYDAHNGASSAQYYLLVSCELKMSPPGTLLFYKCNEWLWYASRPSKATALWGHFWRRDCWLICIWSETPTKSSCTLQIYGQIYVLGDDNKSCQQTAARSILCYWQHVRNNLYAALGE